MFKCEDPMRWHALWSKWWATLSLCGNFIFIKGVDKQNDYGDNDESSNGGVRDGKNQVKKHWECILMTREKIY